MQKHRKKVFGFFLIIAVLFVFGALLEEPSGSAVTATVQECAWVEERLINPRTKKPQAGACTLWRTVNGHCLEGQQLVHETKTLQLPPDVEDPGVCKVIPQGDKG